MKRVLFIINVKNFRPSSGHGIFMKGVIETLHSKGHFIDVVTDGPPEQNFISDYGVNVYYPNTEDRLAYSKHSYLFQFDDSFNFEKAVNFRFAITKALVNHIYDLVICNDVESAVVCHQMELYKFARVTSYAHECATVNPELKEGVFRSCYYNIIDKMMDWPEITTLVQTDQNQKRLLEKVPTANKLNTFVLQYPLTDSNTVYSLEKDGLLFIGRHEERKNPEAFFSVLKEIKDRYQVEIKAKVLTRTAHVEKFKKDFAAIGHSNYEILADVVGEEKAKLIQSAKVAFMPYKNESFGIAVLEALRFMPTVVLDKYDWHYNFKDFSNYIVANQKEVSEVIYQLFFNYSINERDVVKEFEKYQEKYETALLSLLEPIDLNGLKQEPRFRLYSKMKEIKGRGICLRDYIQTENTKGVIYLASDIEPMHLNKKWFEIYHTKKNTYVGLPDASGQLQFNQEETAVISSFFE